MVCWGDVMCIDAVGDEGEKSGAGGMFAIQLEDCDWSLVDGSSSL